MGTKGYDESTISKVTRIKNTKDDTPKRNKTISFLSREDTLYMKRAEGYELKGMNSEIEMYNKIKMMQLQNGMVSFGAAQNNEAVVQDTEDNTPKNNTTNIEATTADAVEPENTGDSTTESNDTTVENTATEDAVENTAAEDAVENTEHTEEGGDNEDTPCSKI